MATKHTNPGTPANPSTDSPTDPGQATQEGDQETNAGEQAKNQGNDLPHGHVSHGGARFLLQVDPETLPEDGWIEELQERYRNWIQTDDTEQSSMEEWLE